MSSFSRRDLITGLAAGAATTALIGGSTASAEEGKTLKTYPNEHFYKSDGSFDAEAARAAFYEMFQFHGYPIVPRLKTEDFWVADFGLGNFTEVGMGGIFWLNLKEENYFGHEIFLLPGQMIPEHKHVETPDAEAKRESWHVRHGDIHIYGEGTPTPGVDARIPPMHRDCCVARTEKHLAPGELDHMGGPEQWHWMRGGEEGAIVTEYATYHDGAALRFTLSEIKF